MIIGDAIIAFAGAEEVYADWMSAFKDSIADEQKRREPEVLLVTHNRFAIKKKQLLVQQLEVKQKQ